MCVYIHRVSLPAFRKFLNPGTVRVPAVNRETAELRKGKVFSNPFNGGIVAPSVAVYESEIEQVLAAFRSCQQTY